MQRPQTYLRYQGCIVRNTVIPKSLHRSHHIAAGSSLASCKARRFSVTGQFPIITASFITDRTKRRLLCVMATMTSSQTGAESAPPQPATNVTHSHPFTCNTCQVAFRSSDLQRSHMHSDWQYVSTRYFEWHNTLY